MNEFEAHLLRRSMLHAQTTQRIDQRTKMEMTVSANQKKVNDLGTVAAAG
jgi:hypothetical protein